MKKACLQCLFVLMSAVVAPSVLAAGSGSMGSSPSMGGGMSSAEPEDPAAAARRLYNDGVKLVERADQVTGDDKKARKSYASALKKFESAVERDAQLAEAWNYVGYCRRKTGDYAGALGAYDEALRLKPGFPEALEYRGHAYLGLGRIQDSQRDYMDLFGRNRALAAKLLAGMRSWSGEKRAAGGGDAQALDALDAWIAERDKLAQQTASLQRSESIAGWK